MRRSAFVPADILLPVTDDMESWSVLAGDQFSEEREYWDRIRERSQNKLSTLNLIIPEAYAESESVFSLADRTKSFMESYLKDGCFEELKNSFVYVERQTSFGLRKGIVGAIDLERFEYLPGRKAPVRSSERTVAEKLPQKMLVRDGAPIETSSALVFIRDEFGSVIAPFSDKKDTMRKLYDFDLMEKGGHITGYHVEGENAKKLTEALEALSWGNAEIIVGDGNHFLAAAKELWEKTKLTLTEKERENHPARFALAEIVNLYDEEIQLEPISRVMFNANPERLIDIMRSKFSSPVGRPVQYVVKGEKQGTIYVNGKSFGTMMDNFQELLEEYEGIYEGFIDYIHDEDMLLKLTEDDDCVGFIMPRLTKEELVTTILDDGIMPKKSFSVGLARDKRYYLECRKIR